MNNSSKHTKIVYLGLNNMLNHKRGVENVIDFQAQASTSKINYYVHWDDKTSVYKYKDLICIGIKANFLQFLVFNLVLLRIKRREKSIFIHSHNSLMSMACLFQTHLFTIHDALYYQFKVHNHKLKYIYYLSELFLYKRVNYVHFISDFAKKMSLFSGKDKFIIIPNTSHFERNAIQEKEKLKVEFNDTKTKVFVVRSIEQRARIDLMLKVAEQLKNSNYEIFVAGKGPLYDYYTHQIQELGLKNIKLLGYVSDDHLIAYYLNCDVVLVPAEFAEGFGLPIIEGYLFNKPVIASNRCAIPDVIISDKFLFDNTVESIIEKLTYASTQRDENYKNYYERKFSNDYILSQFNHLYVSLM